MQQFDLSLWLQDKSRKVVTRRGNPVRIICTDRKHGEDELPVVFLEECSNGGEFLLSCKSDGTSDEHYATQYDLFFADEEEELTEFEERIYTLINFSDPDNFPSIKEVKEESEILLDLAREEILKDLPKWKKMPSGIQGNNKLEPTYLIRTDYGFYFTSSCLSESENNMYIELVELEKLPKEE